MAKKILCSQCKKETTPKRRSKINGNIVCLNCKIDHYKEVRKPRSSLVEIKLDSVARTNSSCFLCQNKVQLKVVSIDLIFKIFKLFKIIIPRGNRICKTHLTAGGFINDDAICLLKNITIKNSVKMSSNLVTKLIDDLWLNAKTKLDFTNQFNYTENEYLNLFGINKNNFDHLLNYFNIKQQNAKRNHLAAFLIKLRTGLSLCQIGSILNVSNDKGSLSKVIKNVRTQLFKNFVPLHLGFSHVSREELINEMTRLLAKRLMDCNNLILILDGTYFYVEKSSNNTLQRNLFSLHKHRPLVKFMMIVTTTGYILDCFGPYYANYNNNDAKITHHILETTNFKSILQPDDMVIIDRGFRDVIQYFNQNNIKTSIPCFLSKNQTQFTTAEANQTRLVTKLRWIVESVNGRIKKFEYFNKMISNNSIPKINENLFILCSLLNCFRGSLISDYFDDENIANDMLSLVNKENELEVKLKNKQIEIKKSNFIKLDQLTLNDFPILNKTELEQLTLGIYQLRIAKSYIHEHMSQDGKFVFLCSKLENGLLMCSIQSRHSNNKKHKCLIHYDINNIIDYYCDCVVGSRVVGCCSHIAAVICYLSYYRYENDKVDLCSKISSSLIDASQIQ